MPFITYPQHLPAYPMPSKHFTFHLLLSNFYLCPMLTPSVTNPILLQQPPNARFYQIAIASLLLLAAAYLSHLGYLPVDPRTDEARRALVTLEMMSSGNYWVPTLNGEPFLNKPPLFNWILLASYKLFGVTPFALRLPVVLFTFMYSWIIWWFTRRYTQPMLALLAALFFATNGRILIYDSLQGLIDIGFSSLVFLGFMWVYHYGQKQQYALLFLLTYLAAALAFLMKGLPALVFQGIALLVYFTQQRRIKQLFSWQHLAGITLFVLIVGGYYTAYFMQAGVTVKAMFSNMLVENTKRTVVDSNWPQTIKHFTTFPISLVYHFAPWALLMVFLLRRQLVTILRSQPFIWYCSWVFLPGFTIYWLSPNMDTAARYFFMMLPLLYIVLLYLYQQPDAPAWQRPFVEYAWVGIVALLGLGSLALPFIAPTASMPYVWLQAPLLAASLLLCAWQAWRHPKYKLVWLVMALVMVRWGFNWFVITNRGGYQAEQKAHFYQVMQLTANRPLAIDKKAYTGNTDGFSYLYTLTTGRILPLADTTLPGRCYITSETSAAKYPHQLLYRWPGHLAPDLWLVVPR